MSDPNITIKGELHTSRADLEEERDILLEGVDHLILEGAEEENWRPKLHQYWYAWILLMFEYLFARILYVDKAIIEDLAKVQDAEIHYTRESNGSLLDNSNPVIKTIAAILFFVLVFLSIAAGLAGYRLRGAMMLLISALVPLLILRIHESRRPKTGRDKQIARMIEEASESGGRIVAIVGESHAKRISEFLPEKLPEPDTRLSEYDRTSWKNLKDLVYPGLLLFSVLYIVYNLILQYVMIVS